MKEKNLTNLFEENKAEITELPDDVLENVTGAGNPFENVPRVPTQSLDDNLRENG